MQIAGYSRNHASGQASHAISPSRGRNVTWDEILAPTYAPRLHRKVERERNRLGQGSQRHVHRRYGTRVVLKEVSIHSLCPDNPALSFPRRLVLVDAINAENQYSAIANILSESLALQQPPIAVCFSQAAPVGIDRHAGRVPAGCRFWEDAATNRFVTTAADHSHCAIGVYTHNLRPSDSQQRDLVDALSVFRDLGYVREEDLPLIPVLAAQPEFVVYAPLAETPLPPDVVILFVKANQTLILSEV